MRKLVVTAVMALSAVWSPTAQSRPASWPGLWGPSRNGESAAGPTSLAPANELWRRKSAGGYAEVAVADGRAITMELREGSDFVVALDAATGRERWAVRVGQTYKGHDGSADGPIATPAAHLLVLGQTSGELRMVRASPDGYAELSRTRVFTPEVTSMTGPAIADGKIYLRNLQEIAAFRPGA